jgi:ribosomal-protein-alanine N-acetyltransferase
MSGEHVRLERADASFPDMNMGRKPSTVETARLCLRPLTQGDLDSFASIFSDPEVTRFLGYEAGVYERSRRELEFWIAAYERQGFGMLGMVRKADEKLIGRCGFAALEMEGVRELEIGCVLDRSVWGQGLATEAASAVRDYGFERCGFNRLVSLLHPENTASLRVAEKIGMIHEKDFLAMTQRLHVFALQTP